MTAAARFAVTSAGVALAVALLTVLLVPLVVRLLDLRPSSLRSRYEADVREAKVAGDGAAPLPPVTEADLAPLPAPVRTYLRRAGVVGKPRPRSVHAVFRGRFRAGAREPWMAAIIDQHDVFGAAPRRLFYMKASRAGVPFVGFHRYVGDAATMQVRVAGLVQVVDARGPEMTRSETVTLLNDMCMLAPGALVDAPVTWQLLGDREVRATYSNAGMTISAVLTFDGSGDLVGFVSNDRYQSDGKTHRLFPWSTPLRDFRDFGGVRLPAVGEARWREPAGEWTYADVSLQRIVYDER